MRSVYVVPSIWSASAAQQKIWLTSLASCGGDISFGSWGLMSLILAFGGIVMLGGAGMLMVGCLGRVDRTPAGVFFM